MVGGFGTRTKGTSSWEPKHLGTFEIIKSLGNGISRGFQEVFSTAEATLFRHNTRKTGNNVVKMCQPFLNIAWFECFTDLSLFRYAFNDIQNWEMDALQFCSMVLIFS